jgi:putative acetyltransferase
MDFHVVGPDDQPEIETVRELFTEYQRAIGVDLCFQSFDEELQSLPGKYSPPSGRLLLVCEGDRAIACGALRPLGDRTCEIKRIYVRPEGRRKGLARAISNHLIGFARTAGYDTVRLDTMRRMTGAIELYEQLGFRVTEPYNYSPEPDIVYMEIRLH